MLKEKAFCGTPLVAGTHCPVARFVVICKVKFVPADAGQKTKNCPPAVLMDSGGALVVTSVRESCWVATPPRLSVAYTLKLNAPFTAAMPERRPFVAMFRFAGRGSDDQL